MSIRQPRPRLLAEAGEIGKIAKNQSIYAFGRHHTNHKKRSIDVSVVVGIKITPFRELCSGGRGI